jgi:carbon-monoxide dehydrogenase small subunit
MDRQGLSIGYLDGGREGMKHNIKFKVNGDEYSMAVDPWRTLNELLRDDLNLTGTKLGCGTGDCGACTVIVDGKTVNSCLTLAVSIDGKTVLTVEGLAPGGEKLHPVQEAFIKTGAIQCGFCTAGMEMSAVHLLSHNPSPTEKEIRAGLSGHLCRCTGYNQIVEAISLAAETMKAGGSEEVDK